MLLAVILSVGFDSSLLKTRSNFLQSADCIVEEARSVKEAIDRFRSGDFDLIILCYSIPKMDRERLVYLIRKHRSLIPVISILGSGDSDEFATATCGDAAETLLPSLKQLLLEYAKLSVPGSGLREEAEEARRARANGTCSSRKYDEQTQAGIPKTPRPVSGTS